MTSVMTVENKEQNKTKHKIENIFLNSSYKIKKNHWQEIMFSCRTHSVIVKKQKKPPEKI